VNRLATARFLALCIFVAASTYATGQTAVGVPNGPDTGGLSNPLNEDHANFTVSTFDESRGRAFYYSSQNGRIMVNFLQSNGTWLYSTSPIAIDETSSNSTITIALGSVLSSATADFYNAYYGTFNKWIMFYIWQGPNSGFGQVCAAFSNDGVNWTQPSIRVGLAGTAQTACDGGSSTTLKLESISAVRSGSAIWLFGLEGDPNVALPHIGDGRSLTYLFNTTVTSPQILTEDGEIPDPQPFWIYAPTIPNGTSQYFFLNDDFAYDPVTDKALLSRSYPYPYEASGNQLCSGVCPKGVTAYPMRSQVYSHLVRGNFLNLLTGSWNLELDIGRTTGWSTFYPTNSCQPTPATGDNQAHINIDTESINLHKDSLGNVSRPAANMVTLYLAGYQDLQTSCNTYSNGEQTFLDGALYRIDWPLSADSFKYYTVTPCRMIDTRVSGMGAPSLSLGVQRTFILAGSCGVPSTAKSLALNLTLVVPSAGMSLAAFPANISSQGTNVVSASAGAVRAGFAAIRLATDGSGGLAVLPQPTVPGTNGQVDFLIDVMGYFDN